MIEPMRAAGVMFITKDDHVLLLKRSETSDHGGEWCFPGGRIEGDESAEQAARREACEETGYEWCDKEVLVPWTRTVRESVDYTVFIVRSVNEFTPNLNDEHTGWCWAKVDRLPEKLHPGVAIAFERLGMDELGVARAMVSGDLTSPQRYGRFWLFAIRITGTGLSYRDSRDEYVWRDESIYLNEEFLARINGLPVIFEHPTEKPSLDGKEFNDRIVGTVFVPYLKGDEVWAVCRIYDEPTVEMLLAGVMSTSPGVVFSDSTSANETVKLNDGSTLLIEGKATLVDHIAICENGVWDKGGPAKGIESTGPEDAANDSFRKTNARLDELIAECAAFDYVRSLTKIEVSARDLARKLDRTMYYLTSKRT